MNLSTYIPNITPHVIAIGGPTGTGKSTLAIGLASIFRGEVVNADAVQLYEGLTIATNKVSESEAAGVPHHLIGCFPPAFAYCADVHKYRAVCLPTIDKIRYENQRIPFLVGGTHYYLEAILWSDFLTSTDKLDSDDLDSIQIPTDLSECYTQLQALNSAIASKLHPKDGRKVRRALREALLHQSDSVNDFRGQPLEQNHPDYPPNRSYQPRYPNQSLFLWLDCDPRVLNERLDARVDQMVRSGLVAELDRFLTDYFREVDLRDKEAQSPM
ncbi:ubiquitin carboxyl-terminal hydrolase 8, partial [Clonorchis sinensis]